MSKNRTMRHCRLWIVLVAPAMMTTLAQTPATPPSAPVREHSERRHGETGTDNYYWLREKSNPEVEKYLEAENAYTASVTQNLKPFEDALYKEMLGRIKQTDLDVPVRRGEYLYYARTEEGKQYPIRCRRKGSMDAPEEIVLDANELAKTHKFVGIGATTYSDDGNLLAYTVDFTGFRQYSLQVKDLRSGVTLPDTMERIDSVEWAADNKTLFLTTEDAVTKRSDHLWRHVLGAAAFEPVYEEKDELYNIGLDRTRDKQYVLLGIEAKDTTEWRYLRAAEPESGFKMFLPREKGHRYYVDHREGLFYIRTNRHAVNFAIFTAPVNEKLEGVSCTAQRRPSERNRSVSRLCGRCRGIGCCKPIAHIQLQQEVVDRDSVLRRCLLCLPRRDARIYVDHLPLLIPKLRYAAKRLRLRYTDRHCAPAQAPGGAGRLRSIAICERTPVGHRAGWHEGADFDRLQEGLRTRRQRRVVPLRIRVVRHRHLGDVLELAFEFARSRHGLSDSAHPRRR